MDPTTVNAIIGAAGVIAGAVITAIIGPNLSKRRQNQSFKNQRQQESIPDIIDRWETKWYIGDKLLHKGEVKLKIGKTYNAIEGTGTSPGRPGTGYSIDGEIAASRFLLITYKNNDFPTTGYIGTGILQISANGKSMKGTWAGRSDVQEEVESGRIELFRKG